MTNKYYYVRRAVWEYRYNNKQKSLRSFQKMRKLFKVSMWFLFILMLICDFILGYILYSSINDWLGLIPATAMFIIFTLADTLPESTLYNMTEREKEIEEKNNDIINHLDGLVFELSRLNVNSPKQRALLKSECESRISAYQNSVNTFIKNLFHVLIAVPIIAFLEAVITKQSTNPQTLVVILCLSLIVIFLLRAFSPVFGLWCGTNKDKALLDELNELEYYDK